MWFNIKHINKSFRQTLHINILGLLLGVVCCKGVVMFMRLLHVSEKEYLMIPTEIGYPPTDLE